MPRKAQLLGKPSPTCQMLSAGIASTLGPQSLAEYSYPTSGSIWPGVSPAASVLETSAPMSQHQKQFSPETGSTCLVRSFEFLLMPSKRRISSFGFPAWMSALFFFNFRFRYLHTQNKSFFRGQGAAEFCWFVNMPC